MRCDKCGYQNPKGAKFCGHCQNPLPKRNQSTPVIGIAILVCAIITGAFFLFPKKQKPIPPIKETTQNIVQKDPLSKEAALSYLSALESALAENRIVYSEGDYKCQTFLCDLDNDGQQEFVVSHLYGENVVFGEAHVVLSVYDYESGSLIHRIRKQEYADFGSAGLDSYVSLISQNNLPVLMTYTEIGETSCAPNTSPNRTGTAVIYNGSTCLPEHTFRIDRENNHFTFSADNLETTEKQFANALEKYDNLSGSWNDHFLMLKFPQNATSASEMLSYLQNKAGVPSVQNTTAVQQQNPPKPTEPPPEKPDQPNTQTYMGMISAGQYHSVALFSDGTVGAEGRSDRDRRDVDGWKNIIAVSAYSHTVGLRSDGTVVAAGDWVDGRCKVSGWSNIVDIDTGEKNTIGLKADGTVVVVGDNDYHQRDVSSWSGIVDVAIGTRTSYGVTDSGRVMASGGNNAGQRDVGGWSNIVSVSAGPYHVVGLKSDGTVVATGDNTAKQCNVSGWTDIVAVSAGNKYTLGLKKNGTVVSCGQFKPDDLRQFNSAKIVAVSAGMNHAIALTSEGKVIAVGNNGRNQCKIDGYDIF